MQYTRLGSSGLKVSRIALGMMSYGDPADEPWFLSADAAEPILRRAVEAGVTFFDTADMYSNGVSEEVTGRLLRELFVRRDDYVLATKVFYPMGDGPNDRGLSRAHLMNSIDASLRRLGTDYVDLYQIHRWDPETPIEETMQALEDLVRVGKVRYLGASLMYAWQFAKAQYTAAQAGGTRFVSMQTRYNLLYREEEREMIPQCADQGVGVLAYSPLARGVLAAPRATAPTVRELAEQPGRLRPPAHPNDAEILAAVEKVAAGRSVPPATVALAWLLAQPIVVAPIVGATRPDHLTDILAAVDLSLSTDEVAALAAPYQPRMPFGYS
ncbi:aldo/keto reductase [Tenggerimyces flavus]|uniref:Aldo/keto reductase n=1 Tax=Tenggerimyces flavus TaxID=1708749 RepID=A0ABV7YRA2_9ACTN|nr:aldo/keto reductase [Tenggerimyces flavus]MBM7790198.1 aryl-alcohol dehydrogenase-like predicted oxidoreductase [Tenggerimyces flavus]